ncbi:unnamed protein product, partial [Allacma fusca]
MTRRGRMALVKTVLILTAVFGLQILCPVNSYELASRRSEYLHRFKSLDRIRSRLDGNSQSVSEGTNSK